VFRTQTRSLIALAALLLAIGARAASAQPNVTATSAAGVLFACPGSDGDLLSSNGLSITATVLDNNLPVPGLPASDFWLVGCGTGLAICSSGTLWINPGATNGSGIIVLDGRLRASGCDNTGLRLVFQGSPLPTCLPIQTRSADLNSDGVVNLSDFAEWATHYPTSMNPTAPYMACGDFAAPNAAPLRLADFAKFAVHLVASHSCQ